MRLNDAASGTGRSLNKEIVDRLEQSLRAAPEAAPVGVKREDYMRIFRGKRTALVLAATVAVLAAVLAGLVTTSRTHSASPQSSVKIKLAGKELQRSSQGGVANGGGGGESADLFAAQQQWDNTRTAPGIVAPGAYSAAFASLQGLSATRRQLERGHARPLRRRRSRLPRLLLELERRLGSRHRPHHRARGRHRTASSTPAAPTAASGARRPAAATGSRSPTTCRRSRRATCRSTRPARSGTAPARRTPAAPRYVGSGVYRLANPATRHVLRRRTASAAPSSRARRSTTSASRATRVYAATLRGVYSHSVSGPAATPWKLLFAPSPSYLPGGADSGAQNAGYQNIVNDLAVDPKNAKHLIAAAGWRGGAAYNGFYESKDARRDVDEDQPGRRDQPEGHRLRNVRVRCRRQQALRDQRVGQALQPADRHEGGQHAPRRHLRLEQRSTRPARGTRSPTRRSSRTRARRSSSRSAARATGRACRPGTTSSSRSTRPTPNHVYAGLEEVYETQNAGAIVDDDRPVLELLLLLLAAGLAVSAERQSSAARSRRTPTSTRSRSARSAARRTSTSATTAASTAGPPTAPSMRTATAPTGSRLNDGTIDALQYYYVGVGKLNADDAARPDLNTGGDSVLVSGGLQDNGGSLIRPGGPKMVSNFGGDGGDVLVDPADGCNIVQEYVYLSMRGHEDVRQPGPGSSERVPRSLGCDDDRHLAAGRQRAVHRAVHGQRQEHQPVAGRRARASGTRTRASASRPARSGRRSTRCRRPTRPSPRSRTRATGRFATWCGPCSNSGAPFARGAVVGTFAGGTWTFKPVAFPADFPNRYLQGAAIDPKDENHLIVGVNGFSRRFTEGPGAGIGHIFESKDGGLTWTDISGNFPDIPVNDVVSLPERRSPRGDRPRRPLSRPGVGRRGSGSAASCRSRSRWT